MNTTVKRLTLSAALVVMAAAPAAAQTGWGALGIHGSWMDPANHARGPQENLQFDRTAGVGGSLETWLGQNRQWGLGLSGTYARSDWRTAFGPGFPQDVNTFNYDASLQFRLAQPTLATRFLPFISLGVGGVTTNPQNIDFPAEACSGTVAGHAPPGEPAPPINLGSCGYAPADVILTTDRKTQLAAVGGIGFDWFATPNVALRLEAKDYWTDRSPYRRLSDNTFHRGGHNFLFNAGLQFYMGRMLVQEPGFVREDPIIAPPPPAPAPTPAPPAPAEEVVMMCVIEPANYQIRMIEAIHVPTENRTYIMRNGQRVAFETAYTVTAPNYVGGAGWYLQDRPLSLTLEPAAPGVLEPARIDLVRFGSPAQFDPENLVFMGTIEGTPIYAMRGEIGAFRNRLEGHHQMSTDLGMILRSDETLAREFAGIRNYYVAVDPACVFQPVSVTHFVRRTRG